MRTWIVLLCLQLTACAFKGQDGNVENDGVTGQRGTLSGYPYQAQVTWNVEGAPTLARGIAQSGNAFRLSHPITVSEKTPSELTMYLDLPKTLNAATILFLRASILSGESRYSVPADLLEVKSAESNLDRLLVKVGAINSTLSRTKKSKGILEIEAFDGSQKRFMVTGAVRTPPAGIEITSVSTAHFRESEPETYERYQTIEARGHKFNLVKLIEIQNSDDEKVWTKFKKEGGSQVVQNVVQLSHADSGCGASVSRSGGEQVLTDRTFFTLLDESAITNLVDLMNVEKSDGETVVELEPQSKKLIGVFGVGAGISKVRAEGVKETELRSITVPGECYQFCIEREPPICGGRGCIMSPDSVVGCARYETRRRETSVTVGTERSPLMLHSSTSQSKVIFRFSDLDSKFDPESRTAELIGSRIELDW